jgi:hypothetical protein
VSGIDEIIISGVNNDVDSVENWVLTGGGQNPRRWRLSDGTNAGITYPDEFIVLGARSASPSNVTAILNDGSDNPNLDVSSNIVNGVLYFSNFSSFDVTDQALSSVANIPTGSTVSLTSSSNAAKLEKDYVLNTFKPYYESSGYLNTAKIEVVPADINNDGIPDDPFLFTNIVGENDLVFHETVLDANGDDFTRIWSTIWKDLRSERPTLDEDTIFENVTYSDIVDAGLFLVLDTFYSKALKTLEYAVMYYLLLGNTDLEALLNDYTTEIFREARDPDTNKIKTTPTAAFIPMIKVTVNSANLGNMATDASRRIAEQIDEQGRGFTEDEAAVQALDYLSSLRGVSRVFLEENDLTHQVFNGRSYTLNADEANPEPFEYKWRHFSPSNNRIDPSTSNIMDMILLTQTYYDEVNKWKTDGDSLKKFPVAPTTEELRANFSDLDNYKMMSDEIIFGSSSFKVIFGQQAKPELRAKFKVVKVPSTTLTNNEIRSRVVELIDDFFNVENWDFGETFYFTELAAYIHKNMAGIIGSIVLVPESLESQFGNLFQVKSTPNELFLSKAQVSDIIIVDTLTENNMRL